MGGYYRKLTAIWDIYESEINGDSKVYYVKETKIIVLPIFK